MYRVPAFATLSIFLLSLPVPAHAGDGFDVAPDRLEASLERSLPYLQREGRAWYEGEVKYQANACVSCHQVPAGIWSLGAAHALLQPSNADEFRSLLKDATEFVSDPEVGQPATWSQLLIGDQAYRTLEDGGRSELFDVFLPLILKAQQADGSWLSKGQFPSQRRPIRESDAVVTMWTIRALELCGGQSPDVAASIGRAKEFIHQSEGESIEWLAWRLIMSQKESPAADQFLERLVSLQRQDGGWGWTGDAPSNAYSTGVALYALSSAGSRSSQEATERATTYLLASQESDGSWAIDGNLISKKSSDSRDYVYRYWSTAWATIGIVETLRQTE